MFPDQIRTTDFPIPYPIGKGAVKSCDTQNEQEGSPVITDLCYLEQDQT